MRKRLLDFRTECDVADFGLCISNVAEISHIVNRAQRRLMLARENSDEGWYGTWAEMAFTVTQAAPYLTTPRDVARIEKMNVCQRPVVIQNQFYEYLNFGNGNLPKLCGVASCGSLWGANAYGRNNAVTFKDLTNGPQYIRIYTSDASGADLDKRVLVQGLDSSGAAYYSTDNNVRVNGLFVTLQNPFVDVTFLGVQAGFTQITGIQKDVTTEPIEIMQVDPSTGEEVSLLTMQPNEKIADYRRYYLDRLPPNCCQTDSDEVQIAAIVKLELIPVVADPDYLLIQNIEALAEECQAIRYSKADSDNAKQMSVFHHKESIRLLQGELQHYLGKEKPAVSFHPFGSFNPQASGIGMI